MSTRSKSSQAHVTGTGQARPGRAIAQGTLRKVMGMGTTARFRFRLQLHYELPDDNNARHGEGFAQLVKRANSADNNE